MNRVGNANPALSSLRNPVYGTTSLTLAGTNTTSQLSMRGCDGTFTNINSTNTTTTGIDALTCVAGGTNTVPDSIAVSYEADRFNTIPTGGTSSLPTDCLGNKVAGCHSHRLHRHPLPARPVRPMSPTPWRTIGITLALHR